MTVPSFPSTVNVLPDTVAVSALESQASTSWQAIMVAANTPNEKVSPVIVPWPARLLQPSVPLKAPSEAIVREG